MNNAKAQEPAQQDAPQSQETQSLVRRLAGPSSGKAGLSKDQTEINRIIAEASKGSKFYENEKKKDKELTIRIEKMLKLKDELTKGTNLDSVAHVAEQLLSSLEAQRDLTQFIVHVDMDAFFASVELLDKPSLAGKAFAVGWGVLTTASYEARRYGVRSGMAGFIAKKLCPELVFMPNRHARYAELSNQVMEIFLRYDTSMCPAGCDEAYLNITEYCAANGLTATECVQQMRETVFRETKLTVSAGIAPNKMLAKICSDKNKPNGQFQLDFDSASIKAFMRDLSIRKVPGIGRVNERLLEAVGIKTCGDIYTQRAVISLMDKQFGSVFLFRTYLGIASNNVQPHEREERKSIGAERTFSSLADKEKILDKLREVAEELEDDMKRNGWTGRTVTLKYKLDTYQVFTRAKSCTRWVSTKEELFSIGKELLLPELPLTLRLIGLRVTKLKDLKAPEAKTGIKRFFEPTKDSSSRKRVKMDGGTPEPMDEDHSDQEEDAMADSMPGYHEHDERDEQMGQEDEPIDLSEDMIQEGVEPRPRPPHSHAAESSNPKAGPSRPRRQSEGEASRKSGPSSAAKGNLQQLECPICGRTLETDNQGLNAHIDFCLSKSAIMEAQSETNKALVDTPNSGPKPAFKGWTKPPSLANSKGKAKPKPSPFGKKKG